MTLRPLFHRTTVCSAALFCTVFLQKFGMPLGDDLQGPLLIPILSVLLLYLLMSGQALIETQDAILFGLFGIAVIAVQLLGDAPFSLPSVLLLLTLSSMFCVKIPIAEGDYRNVLQSFQYCMLLITAIEFGQYAVQLFGRSMPVLTGHVPDWILLPFFNYTQPIYYGADIFKANGFFMLETSFMAQFLGLALGVEVAVFKRTWLIILFLVAVTISLGGTGMVLAAIAMTTLALKQPRLILQMSILLTIAVIAGFSCGLFDIIAARLSEFSDPNASAGIRFLLPYIRMYENMTGSVSRFMFGAGAGFLDRTHGFAWSSPSKVWVEEGFLSFLLYMPFILSVFFRRLYAPILSVIVFSEYLFVTGGGLMQPCAVGAAVFLATGYIVSAPKKAASPELTVQRPIHEVRPQELVQRSACT
jgi:hypothetical protein